MTSKEKKRLNIALLGDERAGKTSFIKRLCFGEFDDEYFPTKVIYTELCKIESDNSVYTFLDYPGREKEQFVIDSGLLCTDVFILIFDLTNVLSYENCKWWLEKVKLKYPKVPIILVGTKSDCENILTSQQINLTKEYKIPYVEVSSKSREGFFSVLSLLSDIV